MKKDVQKIDGRAIAADINKKTQKAVAELSEQPVLTIVRVGEDAVTESFLKIKQRVADIVGVETVIVSLPETATEDDIKKSIDHAKGSVVIQLPLPTHIDTDVVLAQLPAEKDPDALSLHPQVHAPVVGAAKEVLERNAISFKDTQVLVVGQGRLVGAPVIEWLKSEGVEPMVADEHTEDLAGLTKEADIIISGAGVPHLITADMVKDQVVLIDAGTSSDGGVLKGDIHPDCYEKASLYTPVPGGIGPVTVAKLFENVVILSKECGV